MYTTSSEPASIVKKLTYFTVSSLRLWRIWIVPPSIGETKYSFNLPAWISSFSIVASDGWFGIRSESTCRNMWRSFCEKLVGIDGDLAILSKYLLQPNSATQAAYPSTDNAYCLSRHIFSNSNKMLLNAAQGFLWMYNSSAQLLYSNDSMIEDANRKDFLLISMPWPDTPRISCPQPFMRE